MQEYVLTGYNIAVILQYYVDNYMKGLTGLETALSIRRVNTACHIVFVTAADEQNTFMIASPLQILSKPVQKQDVKSVLDTVLTWKTGKGCRG